jgi:hypothetical protein
MSNKKPAPEGDMSKLHADLAKTLSEFLREMEEPNAALLNVARQFLRDNDITCDPDAPNPEIRNLAETMQERDEDDIPDFLN